MNKKELIKFKEELLKKKADLLHIVKKSPADTNSEVGDMIDIASDSVERELMFELSDNERVMINDIENALQKIEDGRFGKCESCSKPIAEKRLSAVPFARYCIDCQSKSETKKQK
jgi:DnaK suppressor protein